MSSLRGRLFVAAAAAVLVSILATVGVGAWLVRRSATHEARKVLDRQADLLAAQERAAPQGDRLPNLGRFLATQQQRVSIVSREQAVLLLPPDAAAALSSGRPADGSVTVGGTRFLYAARPAGRRVVVLLRAAHFEAGDWRPFALSLLVAALVGSALAALAAFFLARAIARPVQRVADAARQLATGDRPSPISAAGPTEAVALANAFNEMTEELEAARAGEKSFLLSVSHELKTPLTAIVSHAEGVAEGVVEPEAATAVIMREARRLDRLVQDLLELARLNQRTFTVKRVAVDLVELSGEAVTRYRAQAESVGVSLVAAGVPEAPALADPDRVLQVLSNLIENALRCTPTGGTVTVTVGRTTVGVEDTGPGLAADDLPRAFERFYLYDRYKSNRRVGTGLGLAIVKELTEAMGGSVAVSSRLGEGTRFRVTLPSAAEPDTGDERPRRIEQRPVAPRT
jgi:signal transduction histidine kinase